MDRADVRTGLARLSPERRRRLRGVAAGLLLGAVAAMVLAQPGPSLTLIAVALSALFFVTQPHWTVLVILVVSTLRLNPARVGPLSTAELLAAVLALPLVLELLRDRKVWVWHVPEMRLVLGIAAVSLVATVWSLVRHPPPPVDALDQPWNELFFFGQSLLFLLYFVHFIKTPRHLVYAVVVTLLMILAASAEAAYSAEHTPGRGRAQTAYFGGFTGNENRLAHLCVWGTALFWSLRYKAPRGWWRRMALGPVLALPVVALMTGSRSGLLQLMVLAGLILLEQRQWAPAQRARACALVLTVGLVVLVAAPAAMVERASDFDVGGRTTADRLHAIEAGVSMIAENPVFGVGPGNFEWRYQIRTGQPMTAHNSYVHAIASGGPLLLLLYLALFYRIHRTLQAVERRGPPAFVWLTTALRLNLIMLLVFSFFATVWTSELFWLLIGLTIVLARIASANPHPIAAAPAPATVATG